MAQIVERYLTGYYSPGLEAVQVDGEVLFGLIKKVLPATHKHMKKHRIEPILYMTEWFMCIFARTLPWTSVLRVWDMFFCEGVKILFRVALVLLKHTLGTSQQLADSPGLYETMERLKNIPDTVVQEDFLASEMLKIRVFEKDLEAEHSLSLARRKAIRERQLSSEKAAAMARDIEVKKKTSKTKNPAKEWEKEKKKKEKERLKHADSDSVISVPNSLDMLEEEDAESVRNGVDGDGTLRKDDKKKKKKEKKQKSKEKLSINTKAAMSRNWSGELHSPDIEKEYEIVDRLSSSSASPTKSVKSRSTTGFSEKDYTSEDGGDGQGSKKKKKDKKKKSKGKETDVISIGDDTASMVISTEGLTDTIDRKKKKDKKKKRGKSKEKGSSGEEKGDDVISIMTVPDNMMFGAGKDTKKDKKKEKKRTKNKDSEIEMDLPGMVRGRDDESVDKLSQADTESIKSLSKKDKKKEKKKRAKELVKEAQAVKGNGVIRNEHASDGNTSSPANLSDYEIVERWKPPSDSSKRGSEKRMGLIYSDDDIQSQWAGMASLGPLSEIPTFDEIVERKRRSREQEERRSPRLSEPTSPISESTTWNPSSGTGMPHSYSNGMEPESGLSQVGNSRDIERTDKAKAKGPTRDYHSFDYGTTV
nr:cylicin-1-like [Lytechinus pictus]